MITCRKYKDQDFEKIFVLLNEALEYDSLERFLLREKLYEDPDWNPDTTYLVENDKEIVGFLQGVQRNIKNKNFGYIKLFAVKKEYRSKGLGSELLQRFEEDLRMAGIAVLRIFDAPYNYLMPGVDPRYTPAVCFFERRGFIKKDEAINMEVDLSYSTWDVSEKQDELRKNEIHIQRCEYEDEEELMLLLSEEWKLWEFEVKMAMKTDPIAIFIAKKEGSIKAFSAWDGNNRGTGWFGPMGTHPDLRGKGVGGVLLYKCLFDMKKRGYEKCIIPWVGPIHFYSYYAGARITRVFWRYEKEL